MRYSCEVYGGHRLVVGNVTHARIHGTRGARAQRAILDEISNQYIPPRLRPINSIQTHTPNMAASGGVSVCVWRELRDTDASATGVRVRVCERNTLHTTAFTQRRAIVVAQRVERTTKRCDGDGNDDGWQRLCRSACTLTAVAAVAAAAPAAATRSAGPSVRLVCTRARWLGKSPFVFE